MKADKNIKLYFSENSDVPVGGTADILLQQITDGRLAIDAGLLGDFSQTGEYSINYEILTELLEVTKIITSKEENVYGAAAKVAGRNLQFKVQIIELSQTELEASLFIVEKFENAIGESRKLKTFIASYADIRDVFFNDKVKEAFNLITDIEAVGREIDNDEFAKLTVELLKHRKRISENIKLLMEIEAEIYVIKMLEVLERSGEDGREILKTYEKAKAENSESLKVGSSNIYSKLKTHLDNSVKQHGGYAKLKEAEAAKKIIEDFSHTVKEVISASRAPVVEVITSKNSTKATPAGKKATKGSSGSPNKKAPPKGKAQAPKNTAEKAKTTAASSESILRRHERLGMGVENKTEQVKEKPAEAPKPTKIEQKKPLKEPPKENAPEVKAETKGSDEMLVQLDLIESINVEKENEEAVTPIVPEGKKADRTPLTLPNPLFAPPPIRHKKNNKNRETTFEA